MYIYGIEIVLIVGGSVPGTCLAPIRGSSSWTRNHVARLRRHDVPQRTLTVLAFPLLLFGCATRPPLVPFDVALRDTVPRSIEIVGRLDLQGSLLYSLHAPGTQASGWDCISLILSTQQQAVARRLVGGDVRIRARVILSPSMNAMFPEGATGTINGRVWPGTFCHGENVAFVLEVSAETNGSK